MQHDPFLVEAARQGDIAAVQQLLTACRPDLRRIAHTQCAAGVDAEDAVQESLLPAGAGLFGMKMGMMAPVMTLVLHLIWGAVLGATNGGLGRSTANT